MWALGEGSESYWQEDSVVEGGRGQECVFFPNPIDQTSFRREIVLQPSGGVDCPRKVW
jgi:hypothetical protein